ncbi:trypsin-like peptidase domain-containing protein [Streptomyces sp. YC504]|uniref:Trypsin-like peptidase domain-containing protein n=1 Tax=Streptomyces mesophilus TaxID=1775132 RepID=A0A6G4XCR1_9ACTN|nr:trypsin-like peptidase domain-containing protein [Streptomyces mesophilus]NGO74627.1 trypsin-like peptidase domain-containing protein [Streptomyces mesophilus]
MGWFRRAAQSVPRIAVFSGSSSMAAGAAALLSPRSLLTCAHVVNEALGRAQQDPSHPDKAMSEEHGTLRIHVHGQVESWACTARLDLWIPPRPGAHALMWHGDLAVLALTEPAPDWLRPVTWREMSEGQSLRAWHGGGEQIAFADTEVKRCDGPFGVLDGQLSGAAIGPGFSGGPLWDRDDDTAVGLVVAHVMSGNGPLGSQTTVRRSWAISWQAIREELVRAGASWPVLEPEQHSAGYGAGSVSSELTARFTTELWSLLETPAQRAQHARTLAARLGYDTPPGETAPSIEELAGFLASEARALPTLAETLAPAVQGAQGRRSLDQLLFLGRTSGASRLLSVAEHRLLLKELEQATAQDAGLLPRAAREALRYTPLPFALRGARTTQGELADVVDELEALADCGPLPDGSPPVPALLKLVEFVAACTGEPRRTALWYWSEQVCARLGVHSSALHQRRADARTWAEHRPSPVVRLIAELCGAVRKPRQPESFRCALWAVRADGTTSTVVPPDLPLSPHEVGRLIRETAESMAVAVGDSGHSADQVGQIDIVVGRDGLHLPFDEWDAGSSMEFLPSLPLGVKFRLALRCPEVTLRAPDRAAALRRRWESGQTAPFVVDETCSSPEKMYALLETSHRDTTQVVLHGPRAVRDELLQICLAVGVPVVLWDRSAEGHEHAHRLNDVTSAGPLHQLPERIRYLRADRHGAPDLFPAQPSLVWEDTELALPGGLGLMDPSEETDVR